MRARILIQAGGMGRRMAVTHAELKPLVPFHGRPLIAHVLERVQASGPAAIHVAVSARAPELRAYLESWPVEVVVEPEPLGTVGAVGLLPTDDLPLIVLNADVLCDLDLRLLLADHAHSGADVTIATHEERFQSRFGVIVTDASGRVQAYREKPVHAWSISSGHLVLGFDARALIAHGENLGADRLIARCIERGLCVRAHPHEARWTDLNEAADLARAERVWGPA